MALSLLRRPPNTGDKLRGARTPRAVDDDRATEVPADYHASLRLPPRLVSFIALLGSTPKHRDRPTQPPLATRSLADSARPRA